MRPEEMNDIMQALPKLDIASMEVQDQLLYLAAGLRFAESIKPLVVKYSNRLPEDVKFLLKL